MLAALDITHWLTDDHGPPSTYIFCHSQTAEIYSIRVGHQQSMSHTHMAAFVCINSNIIMYSIHFWCRCVGDLGVGECVYVCVSIMQKIQIDLY